MEYSRGKNPRAQKVVIYGTEGIGKSTLASCFPNPIFSDVEGSTDEMDVVRTPKPSSWTMLLEQATYFKKNPNELGTWVIDTADWAEKLCRDHVCSKAGKTGIEDFGYGKGYVYLEEEFGKLLNSCSELLPLGVNVVFTAHAAMKRVEQPDEMGAYERWELKLEKKTAPLLKEWADIVLFCNYKTHVINVDGQGAAKGKNKVQGGSRVIYTAHHPCWDAKNRHGLPEELKMEYSSIAHCFQLSKPVQPVQSAPVKQPDPVPPPVSTPAQTPVAEPAKDDLPFKSIADDYPPGLPKGLTDLMTMNVVTVQEIQQAVASKGYYPIDTPIQNYAPDFINGVLIAAWPQVFKMIQGIREDSKLKEKLGF